MPKADENGTVGCILVLRFCEVITAAVLAFAAKNTLHLVKSHPELQAPPYDKHVLLSQSLVYVGGMTTFVWMFVGFILILIWKGPIIFIYGLLDLGLGLVLSIGAGLQGNYLPATHATCKHAETWQVQDNHPSFFHLAATFGKGQDAKASCNQFVTVWILAVIVIVFQMITAYIGIFCDTREQSILNPYRPFAWFVIVIFGVPYWIASYSSPRIRFGYRFVKKVIRRIRGMEKLEFEEAPKYTPNYSNMRISAPNLQRILNIEHLLLPIAAGLHYDDLLNLSLTSKAIRESVFPDGDMIYRVQKLKAYTCNEDSRFKCLYCNKQVCSDCTVVRNLPSLPGAHHMTFCEAYCSKCYFKTIFPSVSRRGADKLGCRCLLANVSIQDQRMCHACNLKDWQELQAERSKRYVQQLRDRATGADLPEGTTLECAKCRGALKGGARWWMCSKCKGECVSKIHPAWTEKVKRRVKGKEKEEKSWLSVVRYY